jgi:hypothetical protein
VRATTDLTPHELADTALQLDEVSQGRFAFAIERYDACPTNKFKSSVYAARNKAAPYSVAINDVCGKNAAKGAKVSAESVVHVL